MPRQLKYPPNTYYGWRKFVLKRDNYSCRLCGSKVNLECHHIKDYRDFPELRLNINNGITLCNNCHKTKTNYGNKKKYKRSFINVRIYTFIQHNRM